MLRAVLLIILSSLACTKLSNSFDSFAYECSIKIDSRGLFIKVLNPEEGSFDISTIKGLQISFFSQTRNQFESLPITDTGCIKIPNENGFLTVRDINSKASLTEKTSIHDSESSSLTRKKLIKLAKNSLALVCPSQGIYADESLRTPESIDFEGDLGGLEYYFDIYTTDNRFIRRIKAKKFGDIDIIKNQLISTIDLPEGSYDLRFFARHITSGLDSPPQFVNQDASCPLFVIHGDAKILGSNSTLNQVAKGSFLNWKAEKLHDILLYCKEPHNSCQPKNCQDSVNFTATREILANEVGVYDYYIKAEDPLKRQGKTVCSTVMVSEKAPDISVEWTSDELKGNQAVLRKPYAILEAQVTVSHPTLRKDELLKNLECKVSFEINQENDFNSQSIFCNEGRCKGQSLAQFTACDEKVKFSLIDAWDEPIATNAKLRLSVRANDGAGHFSLGSTTLWISKSTWTKDVLDFPNSDQPMDVMTLDLTKGGIPIASFRKNSDNIRKTLARFRDDQWQEYQEFSNVIDFHTFKKQTGELVALAAYQDSEGKILNQYLEFDDDGNPSLKIDTSKDAPPSCGEIQVDTRNRLWCYNELSFHYLEDDLWHKIPALEPDITKNIQNFRRQYFFDSHGKPWLNDNTAIIVFDEESMSWKRTDFSAQLGNHTISSITEDFRGRIWLATSNKNTEINSSLFLFENGHIKEYPSPFPLNGENFLFTAGWKVGMRHINLGTDSFDFASDTWSENRPIFTKRLASATNFIGYDGSSQIIWKGHGYQDMTQPTTFWPIKALGFQSSTPPVGKNRSGDLYFRAEDSSGMTRIIRLKTQRALKFDDGMLFNSGEYSFNAWADPQGFASFAMERGNSLTFTDSKVETALLSADSFPLGVSPLSENRYCLWSSRGLSLIEKNRVRHRQVYENSMTFSFHQAEGCQEDFLGNIWFFSDELGLVYTDNTLKIHSLLLGNLPEGEKVHWFSLFDQGRKVVVGSDRGFKIVDIESGSIQDFLQQDLFAHANSSVAPEWGRLNDKELAMKIRSIDNHDSYYIFDIEKQTSIEDISLNRLAQSCDLNRMHFVGGKTWAYCYGEDSQWALLIREQGLWRKISQQELKPWNDVAGPPIAWTPDAFGHVWFMSSGPQYLFYRYDL